MTKLEEQLLIYRTLQRERKEKAEKEAREAEEARKAEEAKKQKEREKEEQSKQKSGSSSLLNFLFPSPSSSTISIGSNISQQQQQQRNERNGPRIAHLRDGNEDEDGMVIDYLDEDEVDFDFNYIDGYEGEDGRWSRKDYILTIIKFAIYCFLQYMAFKAEWGAVFFIISLLYFIYYNTRTRKRLIGEPSAYSVFNDGCEPIDGAMDANRLVNQLTLGQIAL